MSSVALNDVIIMSSVTFNINIMSVGILNDVINMSSGTLMMSFLCPVLHLMSLLCHVPLNDVIIMSSVIFNIIMSFVPLNDVIIMSSVIFNIIMSFVTLNDVIIISCVLFPSNFFMMYAISSCLLSDFIRISSVTLNDVFDISG